MRYSIYSVLQASIFITSFYKWNWCLQSSLIFSIITNLSLVSIFRNISKLSNFADVRWARRRTRSVPHSLHRLWPPAASKVSLEICWASLTIAAKLGREVAPQPPPVPPMGTWARGSTGSPVTRRHRRPIKLKIKPVQRSWLDSTRRRLIISPRLLNKISKISKTDSDEIRHQSWKIWCLIIKLDSIIWEHQIFSLLMKPFCGTWKVFSLADLCPLGQGHVTDLSLALNIFRPAPRCN
jgi:hypothetical protein